MALCVPAMAATVTVNDNGDGTGTIVVDAGEGNAIVGLALNIDTTGGNISALSISPATFNIYPDAAHDMEVVTPDSYSYGAGSPIANQDAVGEADLSSSFAVSAGMLNGADIAGADGAQVVTINITVDADTNICVAENALRGGIVLTDGTAVAIDGTTVCGDITSSVPCYGDFNGDGFTTTQDMGLIINQLSQKGAPYVIPSGDALYNALMDLNSDGFVTTQDMGLIINYLSAAGAPYVVPCP